MQSKNEKSSRIGIVVSAWAVLCVVGMAVLWRYESAPGKADAAPIQWPAQSELQRAGATHYTLVIAFHPHCPCSRASLRELDRLIAQCGDQLRAIAIFVRPADASPGWEETDLWRDAAAMKNVSVRVDMDGTEAKRFGAETSGQALLYSPTGQLLFQGGITASRGHEGDNDGSDAILAAVLHHIERTDAIPKTDVYGCSLQGNEAETKCLPRGSQP
jgi:hypothetical protein